MAIFVRFPRKGFYHPAFGRLGAGDMAGTIYRLPDNFDDEQELPTGTEIISRDDADPELKEALEENEQSKPAPVRLASDAEATMPTKRAKRPVGQAATKVVDDPVEKTTGVKPRRARRKPAAA